MLTESSPTCFHIPRTGWFSWQTRRLFILFISAHMLPFIASLRPVIAYGYYGDEVTTNERSRADFMRSLTSKLGRARMRVPAVQLNAG